MKFKTAKSLTSFLRKTKKAHGKSNSQIRIFVLTIFPVKDGDLDAYYNNLLGYCQPTLTQTRLKIDPLKYGVFADLMGGPRLPTGTPPNTNSTPGTWNYDYPMAKNSATRTTVWTESKDDLIVDIKAAIYDMFGDIPDNVITPTDTVNTHIVPKKNHAAHVPEPPEITIEVTITMIPLGGGKMEVHFSMPNGDLKMPFPGVNIQIGYSLIPMNAVPPIPSPATSADCDFHNVISEARQIMTLGEPAVGMKLVMFARYVYIKHPTKSGGFGASVAKVVS